jgi:hypothetical protein
VEDGPNGHEKSGAISICRDEIMEWEECQVPVPFIVGMFMATTQY